MNIDGAAGAFRFVVLSKPWAAACVTKRARFLGHERRRS